MPKSIHSLFCFRKKQRTIKRKKKRSKISALESCYANRIYGTFGVEMRAYGQKLVKFCTQTHRRVNLSSKDTYLYLCVCVDVYVSAVFPVEFSNRMHILPVQFIQISYLSYWMDRRSKRYMFSTSRVHNNILLYIGK